MIDLFSLAVSHGLLAIAAWRLFQDEALDADPALAPDADAASEPAGTPRDA